MITLVTEPRTNILGTLREWGVERTEEGRAVYDAWQAVEARFPGVRATYNAIMPRGREAHRPQGVVCALAGIGLPCEGAASQADKLYLVKRQASLDKGEQPGAFQEGHGL